MTGPPNSLFFEQRKDISILDLFAIRPIIPGRCFVCKRQLASCPATEEDRRAFASLTGCVWPGDFVSLDLGKLGLHAELTKAAFCVSCVVRFIQEYRAHFGPGVD